MQMTNLMLVGYAWALLYSLKFTQSPAGAKTPAKHFRVRSGLLCDYGKSPELISGAFPCLFPLGLTAAQAEGTGLLINFVAQ